MHLKSQQGDLLRGVVTARQGASSPKIRRRFPSGPQALPWWKAGWESKRMSHEDEFAGFKGERLAGAGPGTGKACWVGPGRGSPFTPPGTGHAWLSLPFELEVDAQGRVTRPGVGAWVSAPKEQRDL